jgi:acyl-homoserine lactone acylase PvdQ
MEKQRKLASGRLAEIFGEKAVNMDKFSLSVGYRKAAQETWDDKN